MSGLLVLLWLMVFSSELFAMDHLLTCITSMIIEREQPAKGFLITKNVIVEKLAT